MALAGQQTVNLVATVDGRVPTTQSPFPSCTPINAANPFPQSPTPAFVLLTQNVQSISVFSQTPANPNYPGANCAIDVSYYVGSVKQISTILVTQSLTTVAAAL